MATASVVIPAHNEASMISACLDRLLAEARPDEFEVIVVCNGCTDSTAEVARRKGVRVVEIAEASKIAALNAGDALASVYPRIYLDADVRVEVGSLRAVIAALDAGAVAAAPVPRVDTTGCGWIGDAYFAIWSRLGYATTAILGSGIYALSESGRQRFGEFPEVISDDGFVYTFFKQSERINPPGAVFEIAAPRTVASLVRRRVRITAGNLELAARFGRAPDPPGPGWAQLVRSTPRLLLPGLIYASVNAVSKMSAQRRIKRGGAVAWSQDRSTREAP